MAERFHSDEVLIERLRSGDPLAFDVIDARYRRALTRHAEWRLGPARRALAEELVQETFLRAYRSLMACDHEVVLRPWLYRILQNAVVDELRRPAPPDGDPDECPRTTADAVCEVALRREHLRELVSEVAALPDRQRRALVGHVLEGLDHGTIAASLGTTVGASKGLVNRARASLIRSRRRMAIAA
jgi:RNA polymerase sigma-70 factor (ECF subfamily)